MSICPLQMIYYSLFPHVYANRFNILVFNCLYFQAKQQFEKEERRKELKRLRGEDTWMLPDVNQRLQQIEEVSCSFCHLKLNN